MSEGPRLERLLLHEQAPARASDSVDIVDTLFYIVATSGALTLPVGIRELKNRLSYYLERVKGGEPLAVTDHGRTIAYILPSEKAPEYEALVRMVREDLASWKGGKPQGSSPPAKIKGKPVSQVVIEERR
jgi:prevent-host-death family protein